MSHNATVVAETAIITRGILLALILGLYTPEILDALVALFRPKK